MAFVGHFATQTLHCVHLLKSITGKSFTIVIAPSGQFLAQIVQPIQPTEQLSFTDFPLSLELHAIRTPFDAGTKSITFFGHI